MNKKQIEHRIVDLHLKIECLQKEIDNVKREDVAIDFNCPVCKHETLAKKVITHDSLLERFRRYNLYCYGCGNTFEKKETSEWVKVEKKQD